MDRAAGGPAPRPAVERRRPPRALVRAVNPVVRRLVARGVAGGQLLVLHYRGRRTGRRYDLPVGYHVVDGAVVVLTDSGWRHNFGQATEVEATLRGERRAYEARLEDRPERVAEVYRTLFERLGTRGAQRRLGLQVHVDRAPTTSELADLVRTCGLAAVLLTAPRGQAR